MDDTQQNPNPMQLFQQKIGNLELTVHSLMQILEEEGVLDQERVNDKAEEIVQEAKNQAQTQIDEDLEET